MQSQLPVSVIRQPVTKPVMCLTLDVAYICQTAFIVGLNPQRILSPQFETQFLYILTFFSSYYFHLHVFHALDIIRQFLFDSPADHTPTL